jgi:hypothetical protein
LAVGQGLVAEFARLVVGVSGDEAVAVDVTAVLDQSSLVVVGEAFVAVLIAELGQAAAVGGVVQGGGAAGAGLFDEAAFGVEALFNAVAVTVFQGDGPAGLVVAGCFTITLTI